MLAEEIDKDWIQLYCALEGLDVVLSKAAQDVRGMVDIRVGRFLVQPVEARGDRATDLLDLFVCLSVRLLPVLLAFRWVCAKSERGHLPHEVRRQEVEERLVAPPFRFHEEGEVGSMEALLQEGAEQARIAAVEREGNVLCEMPVAPAQCWRRRALLQEEQQRV